MERGALHLLLFLLQKRTRGEGGKGQAFLVLQKIQSHSCKHSSSLESLSFNHLGRICGKKGY